MSIDVIDVWNIETFDSVLAAKLRKNAALIENYMITDREIFHERHVLDIVPSRPNPYADDFRSLVEQELQSDMNARTIRAWHYTRLVDAEVEKFRSQGISLSTLDTLRRRLNDRVDAGSFTAEIADALFAASPFHKQNNIRSNKFWMVSEPVPIDYGGVELLLGNWGGEATYFWLEEPKLKGVVAGLGTPRVIEIAVPLNATRQAYRAAQAVVNAFAGTRGCKSEDWAAFELYSMRPLGPDSVIAIHSGGETNFEALTRGYPAGFDRRL
jgi:hypothetical protein